MLFLAIQYDGENKQKPNNKGKVFKTSNCTFHGEEAHWFNKYFKLAIRQNICITSTKTSRRHKYLASSLRYYNNTDATFNVERNPGPSNSGSDDSEAKIHQIKLPKRGLRIGEWNINHLTDAKFEQINLVLTTSTNIDILFVIETFLKPSKPDSLFNIPGYYMYRKDRTGRKNGGGLLAYVAEKVQTNRVSELDEDSVESLWLTVCPHNSKRSILVGGVYRPPSSDKEHDLKIEQNIEMAYLRKQEMIIVGDFNINALDSRLYSKHRLIKSLKSMHLTQLVSTITRPTSKTCLDHVYTSHPNFITDIVSENIGTSDHLPVFVCRKYTKLNKDASHKVINYRVFKNLNPENLLDDLKNVPWDSAFIFDDVNDILATLGSLLNQVLDDHIPQKQRRVKKHKQPAWITNEIIEAINQRDSLLKKARKSESCIDWDMYKHKKRIVTNSIKKSKQRYFQNSIEENKGDPKGIWKALKQLAKTQKPSIKIAELTDDHGNKYTEPQEISEIMNNFFINILKQVGDNTTQVGEFLHEHVIAEFVSSKILDDQAQFSIPEITSKDVHEIIDKLSNNKATGCDGISVKLLKLIAPVFCEPLTKLLNYSIATNTFPTAWKMARVTPLYKDGERDQSNNYRPISVLSVLSKILEKHVAKSLMNYLVNNNLLYELQSAFREGHSTESALIKLTDQILSNMDQDNVTGVLFIDFKKAFDIVDHQIMLKKLKLYRASESTLQWFKSYLTNRSQFVTIDGKQSRPQFVTHGVPQGSVLGPILFLLFVNDIPLHVSNSNLDIFADDTTLSASAQWSNIPSMVQDLKKDLDSICNWSINNKMVINTEKTKSMLVTGKRLRKKIPDEHLQMDLALGNTTVSQVESQKLLGVIVDQDLAYEDHIDSLCKQISKRLGLLKHISPYLKKQQREIYYNGIIKPKLMYGSAVWSCCSKENLDRILKLQKRAARIILSAEKTTPSKTLFNGLNWISFTDELFIRRNSIVYKRVKDSHNCPIYINSMLVRNSDIHNRETRFSKINMICPRYNRTTEGGKTFAVRAIKDWNTINVKIRNSASLYSFKHRLYKDFLDAQKLS